MQGEKNLKISVFGRSLFSCGAGKKDEPRIYQEQRKILLNLTCKLKMYGFNIPLS